MKRLKIVGYGTLFRRDDAAGLEVVRRLEALGADAVLETVEGDGLALLDRLRGTARAIVVDAMRSRSAPGSVRAFRKGPVLEKAFPSSTHAVGLAQALALGRSLGTLPAGLVVYGIAGADFSAGRGLSPGAEKGVETLVRRLSRRVGCTKRASSRRS